MKKYLLIPVLALSVVLAGCSTAWVSTLDSILAAAAPALIDILQIVAAAHGGSVSAAQVSKINSDAASIKQVAGDLAAADAAAAPGVCSQLKADIGVYQQDEQTILQTAQVSDQATQTKITLLSSLVAGAATAILSVIPQCDAPATYSSTPPLSVKNFVSDYNAILVIKTGNLAVDSVTPKLKLHQHSKLVRIASLGLLK